MPGDNCADTAAILGELSAIKRLLILILLREGLTQAEVGGAIGVSQSTISKMFPKGISKKGT
jgi:predicted transcriptional regulator